MSCYFRPWAWTIILSAPVLSQVSASLPKTSYFKMVDLWLIFCIGITFLTIIFHVVVDNVMHGQSSPGGTSVWVSSLAKAKLGPSVPGTMGATEASQYMPRQGVLGQRVVLATKVMVAAVFFVFNIAYWGYILSQ